MMDEEEEILKKKTHKLSLLLSCFGVSYQRVVDGETVRNHIKGTTILRKQDKGSKENSLPCLPRINNHVATTRTVPIDTVSEVTIEPESIGGVKDSPSTQNQKRPKIAHEHEGNEKPLCLLRRRNGSPKQDQSLRGLQSNISEINSFDGVSHNVEQQIDEGSTGETQSENPNKVPRRPVINGDNFVGLIVVVVTALVMLAYGRTCAVLVTCAWLYVVPYMRNRDNSSLSSPLSYQPDFDSVKYKKKVVLEGLLARNPRQPS